MEELNNITKLRLNLEMLIDEQIEREGEPESIEESSQERFLAEASLFLVKKIINKQSTNK